MNTTTMAQNTENKQNEQYGQYEHYLEDIDYKKKCITREIKTGKGLEKMLASL